jgi:hypothetical protein
MDSFLKQFNQGAHLSLLKLPQALMNYYFKQSNFFSVGADEIVDLLVFYFLKNCVGLDYLKHFQILDCIVNKLAQSNESSIAQYLFLNLQQAYVICLSIQSNKALNHAIQSELENLKDYKTIKNFLEVNQEKIKSAIETESEKLNAAFGDYPMRIKTTANKEVRQVHCLQKLKITLSLYIERLKKQNVTNIQVHDIKEKKLALSMALKDFLDDNLYQGMMLSLTESELEGIDSILQKIRTPLYFSFEIATLGNFAKNSLKETCYHPVSAIGRIGINVRFFKQWSKEKAIEVVSYFNRPTH